MNIIFIFEPFILRTHYGKSVLETHLISYDVCSQVKAYNYYAINKLPLLERV